MKWGRYELSFPVFGYLKLDGGAMFGSVPRNLWNRLIPADEQNRIRLATRSILLKDGERVILIDVGSGDKWDEKAQKIFAFEHTSENELGFQFNEVTDVILTHLHFDHAGGLTYLDQNGELSARYPGAVHHLQEANLKTAKAPNLKEKASYLSSHVSILDTVQSKLLSGNDEVLPDIYSIRIDGHTVGQQMLEVRNGDDSLFFPTDLIPTSHHLPLPYHMGYDLCGITVMEEKEEFLSRAVKQGSLLCFEHDPDVAIATVTKNERGHYTVKEDLTDRI